MVSFFQAQETRAQLVLLLGQLPHISITYSDALPKKHILQVHLKVGEPQPTARNKPNVNAARSNGYDATKITNSGIT